MSDYKKLTDLSAMTRNDIVPYYVALINGEADPSSKEVIRINSLIMEKWSASALLYIKEKAWKIVTPKKI
jgi:hypothetical protein